MWWSSRCSIHRFELDLGEFAHVDRSRFEESVFHRFDFGLHLSLVGFRSISGADVHGGDAGAVAGAVGETLASEVHAGMGIVVEFSCLDGGRKTFDKKRIKSLFG